MASPKKVSKKFLDWMSEWEGEKITKRDIAPAEKAVVENVAEEWRDDRRRFEALVSVVHDLGPEVLTSTRNPLGRILRQQYRPSKERNVGLAIAMLGRAGSRASLRAPGLSHRRKAQSKLFLDGEHTNK